MKAREGYGSLEETTSPFTSSKTNRVMRAVAALTLVALACVVLVGIQQKSQWTSLEQHVATPPNDFTAAKDRNAYNSYFSQLSHTVKKQEAKDKPVQAKQYKTADAAREDLNSFFDNMKVNKKTKLGLTAEEANKQLDEIFPTQEKKLAKKELAQDRKEQQLALSSTSAQDDLDSYFDSLPTTKHHSYRKANSESDATRKYIESKRAAMNDDGSFTEVQKDGSVVKTSDKWSSENARKELDGYFGGQSSHLRHQNAEHASKEAHSHKAPGLQSFEKTHPEFQKQLDMAHMDWMKTHRRPPRTAAEQAAYHKLVESENPQADDKTHKVITAYIKQHPDVAAKFKQLHNEWYAKHDKPPHTAQEKEEYKNDMQRIVGKLNIDSKAVLAKAGDKDTAAPKAQASDKDSKSALLKSYMKTHPELKAKLDKVHSIWAKEHGKHAPSTADEKAEYNGLMAKYVGKVHISGAKAQKVSSTTSLAGKEDHSSADLERAKQNALKDFANHHPGVMKKLAKVHRIWSQTHKAAPSNSAEEKEYDALMAKYVGHPDVSSMYDSKPASAKTTDGNFDDMDASILG